MASVEECKEKVGEEKGVRSEEMVISGGNINEKKWIERRKRKGRKDKQKEW